MACSQAMLHKVICPQSRAVSARVWPTLQHLLHSRATPAASQQCNADRRQRARDGTSTRAVRVTSSCQSGISANKLIACCDGSHWHPQDTETPHFWSRQARHS